MPTEAPPLPPTTTDTAAARAAERTWRANHDALSRHQAELAALLEDCDPGVTWATARDGSVSGREVGGGWVAGCSVPLLAGRALLRSLVVEGGGHCLLLPAHAGVVAAARERVGPDVVLFVIQPDLACCRTVLGCYDGADDIAAGRLWFAAGDGWAAELRAVFARHPGLATPARFVQTRLTPEVAVGPVIAEAQQAFTDVAVDRAATLARRRVRPAPPRRQVLAFAGSRFRLWHVGGEPLQAALATRPVAAYDTDDPFRSALPALAAAADDSAAVVAIDVGRPETAGMVPADVPWVTWMTRPAVPPATAGDWLIVADPAWRDRTRAAGWPADRVRVGVCPPLLPSDGLPAIPTLALIADVAPAVQPEAVRNYSSYRLLWEAIEADLRDDPWAVTDAAAYVRSRATAAGLDPDRVAVDAFVHGLVLPAYAPAVARQLIAAGVPVRLWGQGWSADAEFQPHAAGTVADTRDLRRAVRSATALVRPVPGADWHSVQSCGRPVLSTVGVADTADVARRASTLIRSSPAGRLENRRLPTLADALNAVLGRPAN